jgi:hypothetical protein
MCHTLHMCMRHAFHLCSDNMENCLEVGTGWPLEKEERQVNNVRNLLAQLNSVYEVGQLWEHKHTQRAYHAVLFARPDVKYTCKFPAQMLADIRVRPCSHTAAPGGVSHALTRRSAHVCAQLPQRLPGLRHACGAVALSGGAVLSMHGVQRRMAADERACVQPNTVYTPDWADFKGINDRFAMMAPDAAGVWFRRKYFTLHECLRQPIHAEQFAGYFLNATGIAHSVVPQFGFVRVRSNGEPAILDKDWPKLCNATLPEFEALERELDEDRELREEREREREGAVA